MVSGKTVVNTVTCAGKGFVTPKKHDELPHSFYSTTDNNNYQQWSLSRVLEVADVNLALFGYSAKIVFKAWRLPGVSM